ncbi:MAG: DUF5752 family protein [Candidatus Bathyarchaeia archaeon]
MKDVCLVLEFHQPHRLSRNFNSLYYTSDCDVEKVFKAYFDDELNMSLFRRVANNCYFPLNRIVLEQIERLKNPDLDFKLAYSVSGLLVEQSELWEPRLAREFKLLAESGCVEFLGQTYYHSLASLYDAEKREFVEQVEMHRSLMKNIFGLEPKVFENTECIYNNSIARTVDEMGFKGVVTEGADRILCGRSPNHVYRAKGCGLKVLLRNYMLSDDIGFRFSSRTWCEWPLTSEKYVRWLEQTPGEVIVIFIDAETFGEHHDQRSGILDFLENLAHKVVGSGTLSWSTPSEAIEKNEAHDVFDVDDFATVSWADLERDHTAWLGNEMQLIAYDSIKSLGPLVKSLNDHAFCHVWRCLQSSDHMYYMSTKVGGPGEVHSYFNPYGSPYEAFIVYVKLLADFEVRLRTELERRGLSEFRLLLPVPVEKAFTFYYEFARSTNFRARSLPELLNALKSVDSKSIMFHSKRGDFGRWVRQVVGDVKLADALDNVSALNLTDEDLRKRLIEVIESRIKEVERVSVLVSTSSNDK